MFGYISPDTPYLFKKDEVLYNALYCGLCKSIGRGCGAFSRTALTFDMAFISALLHNIRGEDVVIKRQHCVVHWFKKRPVAVPDDTSVALGCINTMLTYFKLCDDKADGDRRGALRHLYKKGYKRALKRHPKLNEIILRYVGAQRELEAAGCASIDMACEPTAVMMRDASDYLLGGSATEHTANLCYHIGKWVYLIDALDDYDKDVKKGAFNVLFNAFGGENRKENICRGGEEIKFVFDMIFSEMRKSLVAIDFKFNHDLTDNIILRGIPSKTRSIFYDDGCKGCKGEVKAEGVING